MKRHPARADTAMHDWNLSPDQARALQRELASRVRLTPGLPDPALLAGVDVGLEDGGRTARAAVVLLRFPGLEPVTWRIARRPVDFPYLPGLLSFRELPAVLEALRDLEPQPGLIICDGQGIAHPRRLGIASHLGVLLDLPTIGVAKKILVGTHGRIPANKGEWTALRDGDETIGAALRTREKVKPVYVSPGNRIDLARSIDIVMQCVTKYRLPEPTRLADKLSKAEDALISR